MAAWDRWNEDRRVGGLGAYNINYSLCSIYKAIWHKYILALWSLRGYRSWFNKFHFDSILLTAVSAQSTLGLSTHGTTSSTSSTDVVVGSTYCGVVLLLLVIGTLK